MAISSKGTAINFFISLVLECTVKYYRAPLVLNCIQVL